MTTEELSKEMAAQLRESIWQKEIREMAAAKGFTPEQINKALDDAHTIVQQQADKDPLLRLTLGPVLLAAVCVGFYTDWTHRSVGFGSIIGLVCLWIGSRMVISLLKQWARK